MILADTSIWIEFLRRKSPYFEHMLFLLEHREISTLEVVFGELLQGAKNKRERSNLLAYWGNMHQVDSDGLWIEAGLQMGQEKWQSKGLGLIDSALLLAAKKNNCKIWTLDKKLAELSKIVYDPHL